MVFGAATRIRTGDLILTKDALYQLSYSSVATRIRLELTTSSVTGWRSNQLNYRARLVSSDLDILTHTTAVVKYFMAGAERFELSTRGFGDRCSTN